MKNTSKTIILAILAAAAFTLTEQAQAVGITGAISFAGNVAFDTGNLGTATAFTSFSDVEVTNGTGSYAGIPPGFFSPPVTMLAFAFNPFVPPVNAQWSFSFLLNNYSFDLLSLQIVLQQPDSLVLRGSGTLHITGLDDTTGSWIFTANQSGDTFSFSSGNVAQVPDGGTTVMLLGAALGLLGIARRAVKR